jgi:hypothetical protein
VTPEDRAVLKGYIAEELSKRLNVSLPAAQIIRFMIAKM